MCWRGKNIKLTAKEDIIVFKIVCPLNEMNQIMTESETTIIELNPFKCYNYENNYLKGLILTRKLNYSECLTILDLADLYLKTKLREEFDEGFEYMDYKAEIIDDVTSWLTGEFNDDDFISSLGLGWTSIDSFRMIPILQYLQEIKAI